MQNDKFRLISLLLVAGVLVSYFLPMAGAAQFTLYGNVIDGNTCNPLPGVMVTAPYNSNTTNITNSTGGYLLLLGTGSWNVTISKANYTPITFNTSYHTNGAYQFNTYLLKPGTSQANCTLGRYSANSTVPTTVTANSTVTSTMLPTSTQQYTNQSSQNSGKANNNTTYVVGGILILVIIILVVVYLSRGKGVAVKQDEKKDTKDSAKAPPQQQPKEENKPQQ